MYIKDYLCNGNSLLLLNNFVFLEFYVILYEGIIRCWFLCIDIIFLYSSDVSVFDCLQISCTILPEIVELLLLYRESNQWAYVWNESIYYDHQDQNEETSYISLFSQMNLNTINLNKKAPMTTLYYNEGTQ